VHPISLIPEKHQNEFPADIDADHTGDEAVHEVKARGQGQRIDDKNGSKRRRNRLTTVCPILE